MKVIKSMVNPIKSLGIPWIFLLSLPGRWSSSRRMGPSGMWGREITSQPMWTPFRSYRSNTRTKTNHLSIVFKMKHLLKFPCSMLSGSRNLMVQFVHKEPNACSAAIPRCPRCFQIGPPCGRRVKQKRSIPGRAGRLESSVDVPLIFQVLPSISMASMGYIMIYQPNILYQVDWGWYIPYYHW